MRNVLALSALALSLAACGNLATPAPTPPAVVTPEPAGLVLTTEPAQLQAAGLSVTLAGDTLTVRPTGVEAVFRVYLDDQDTWGVPGEAGQFISGAYNLTARAPLTIQGGTPFGWVDVARLR